MASTDNTVRVQSCLQPKLLLITSLDGGAGDKTDIIKKIGGVGSARLHLMPLFRAAKDLDLCPRLISLDTDDPMLLNELGDPEMCVIGKVNHFDDDRIAGFAMAILAAVARLKARKVKIVLLYCDHLAPLPCVRGHLYRDLLALSDHIVVPSLAMERRAKNFLPATTQISVIEDPWQVCLQEYRLPKIGSPLRIGWFGNSNNVLFLCEGLQKLMSSVSAASSIEFVVLSNKLALDRVQVAFQESLSSAIRPWRLELVCWDDSRQPTQLEQVLGSVHVVWLPSNPESPVKGGVSHNRLVDSVRSGAIVVASKMESYQELSQIAILGSNFGYIINRLVPQYKRISQKHNSIRGDLLYQFSPILNQKNWNNFLKAILNEKNKKR